MAQRAGIFLVPNDDFTQRIKTVQINDVVISELANLYCVSREVILRKLLDQGLVDNAFYDQKVGQWKKEGKGSTGKSGNYYNNKKVYLGERYIELSFSRYYHK
ncbi:MAG: hypothetical protein GY841_08290, partial [FCB group bacterium]|nr:hypothetical protein [FCB group bacterium]